MTNNKLSKKIVFLCSGIGRIYRGAERLTWELGEYLKDFYHVTFYGGTKLRTNFKKVPFLKGDNRVLEFAYQHSPWFLRKGLFRLHMDPIGLEMLTFCLFVYLMLLRRPPDLIISSSGFWGNALARSFRTLTGSPFISIGHGAFMSNYEIAKLNPDCHICVSPILIEPLKKALKKSDDLLFLPPAIRMKDYQDDFLKVDVPLDRPIFLCVGALEPVKRIHLTIEAVSRLDEGSLLVLGKGPLYEEIVHYGERKLKHRFLCTDVPFSEMPKYYKASDVFTLASESEAFGLVYLEAMASNKPIVTVDDELRRYIIGEAGILCRCEDSLAYASALHQAASCDFADKPKKQALKFDWKQVGPLYLDIIEGIFAKRKDV